MTILRAILFWFAVAVAAIALCGLYAWLDEQTASTIPVWRHS